ncbi:hypothetical protein CHS0354_029121 [Potamilus streckersoni]|uniref:Uncharacterized protein n=1 Tax=Potamilus streckersoni TaxID=2493646 RepID=A0AAE0SXD3_9BIVA|nr:hypothetical protein CHS0354_029121 [Potamilus streckersoni]
MDTNGGRNEYLLRPEKFNTPLLEVLSEREVKGQKAVDAIVQPFQEAKKKEVFISGLPLEIHSETGHAPKVCKKSASRTYADAVGSEKINVDDDLVEVVVDNLSQKEQIKRTNNVEITSTPAPVPTAEIHVNNTCLPMEGIYNIQIPSIDLTAILGDKESSSHKDLEWEDFESTKKTDKFHSSNKAGKVWKTSSSASSKINGGGRKLFRR